VIGPTKLRLALGDVSPFRETFTPHLCSQRVDETVADNARIRGIVVAFKEGRPPLYQDCLSFWQRTVFEVLVQRRSGLRQ